MSMLELSRDAGQAGTFFLHCRRLGGDITEVYKIMKGTDKVDDHSLSPRVEESNTRPHGVNMRGKRFIGSERRLFTEGGGYME